MEERTFQFAKHVSYLCKTLPRTVRNIEHVKQLIRSSGSVGVNYIEANGALSKKDFLMRIKICRKEAKESAYWLRLLIDCNIVIVTNIQKKEFFYLMNRSNLKDFIGHIK